MFYKNYVKRILDVLFVIVTSVIWVPVFVILFILVLAIDGPPVLYRGERVGRDLKIFSILKFRTMKVGAGKEEQGDTVTVNDDRVTRIGKMLRESKLDELPQLLLVLTGRMSIVGPRPELPVYVDREYYIKADIATLRPGITDLSSIHFSRLSEMIPSENTNAYVEKRIIPHKNRLRRLYAKKVSFQLDMYIICKTLQKVLL